MDSVEKQEKMYEFYEYIANKIVDLKVFIDHCKNPEDETEIRQDLLKIKDACKDIESAYDAITELEQAEDDDDDDDGGDGFESSYDNF